MSQTPADPVGPIGPAERSELVDFDLDLTLDETRRRAQVLAALGPDWDPIAVIRGEDEAYALLYSGLDPQQQATYDSLVEAGVLPRGEHGHAAP
ncbi:DUF6400 family protein [Kitasatospora sp. NPDC052896]|uniref:DUF6400 family protein n=1 Tax=Kitasatospora sp. NPDC052896 TaxID=3364061 RepID=UPI0037C669C6